MHIGDKPTTCIQTRKLYCDAEPFAVVIKQICKKERQRLSLNSTKAHLPLLYQPNCQLLITLAPVKRLANSHCPPSSELVSD